MNALRTAVLFFCWIAISHAASERRPMEVLLCVAKWNADADTAVLHVVFVNKGGTAQHLSKAGNISLRCTSGAPPIRVPGRLIGITRPLEPEIAALSLRPQQSASQSISLRIGLRTDEIAEVRASCDIGGVTYMSNIIYLKR